jgi:hypothetical protein
MTNGEFSLSLCMLFNVKISFTENIINASVMFYNFVQEREYCNSDPNLPLGVVTCHTNYASNIVSTPQQQTLATKIFMKFFPHTCARSARIAKTVR